MGAGNNLVCSGVAERLATSQIFARGNDTVTDASPGSDVLIGGAGCTFTIEGTKGLTFFGTAGAATVIGGSAPRFISMGARGRIAGGGIAGGYFFTGGISGVLIARGSVQTLLLAAGSTDSGSDVVDRGATLSDGKQITFAGVTNLNSPNLV